MQKSNEEDLKKYLKYKAKYLELKDLLKGGIPTTEETKLDETKKEYFKKKYDIIMLQVALYKNSVGKAKTLAKQGLEEKLDKEKKKLTQLATDIAKLAKKICTDRKQESCNIELLKNVCKKSTIFGCNFDEKEYIKSLDNEFDKDEEILVKEFKPTDTDLKNYKNWIEFERNKE